MKYFIESEMKENHNIRSFQAVNDTTAAITLIRKVRNEYQVPWTFELGCLLVPDLERFPQNLVQLTGYFDCQDCIIKMGKVSIELPMDEDIPFDPKHGVKVSESFAKNKSISTKLSTLGNFYVGVRGMFSNDLTEHFRQKGRDWVYTKLQNYQKKFDKDGKDNVFFNYLKNYEEMWLKDW